MTEARKATVTLGGVTLAGTSEIAWRFISGVSPYTTTFTVHKSQWERTLQKRIGQPLTLEVVDSRGLKTTVKELYILHTAPSDSPARVTFVVADKRWRWSYDLIVRDFNVVRKTGDRTANFASVPVETREVIDKYDFLPYSLKDGETRWTAKEALESVLELLEPAKTNKAGKKIKNSIGYRIDSFPIDDKASSKGQFTLQSVMLRDQGDAALARLLSFIPGADLYIDTEGKAVVYNATDLDKTEAYFRSLPPSEWSGDRATWVDRNAIRPGKIIAHYQREVEVVFDYSDDYGGTSAQSGHATPYLDNVIPTVDPQTDILEFDPELNKIVTKTVPPGTWVRVDRWLAAMDLDKPDGSLAWDFDTIRRHWISGDLEGVLGARGLDLDDGGNVAARVQVLKQHFRQTFRINRRYMERIRDLRAVRVALLDPVTGARAPAAAWGQACFFASTKGKLMAARKGESKVMRNVDFLAPSEVGNTQLIETAPGPARVNIVDKDIGVFRLEWLASPYGSTDSIIPCHLSGLTGTPLVITRDLSKQDEEPTGVGMIVENEATGIYLRDSMEMKVILTMVPIAPNNEKQFHRIEVEAGDVKDIFTTQFRIQGGKGPDLELFVPPGEATARFAWKDDTEAEQTVQELLGLTDDSVDAGVEGPELNGFVIANEGRELADHSISLAAEMLAPFADNVQGTIVTKVPRRGKLELRGNINGTTLRVASAPSAKVDVVHQFPGQQRRISRLALMSDASRAILLGVVPFNPE